MPTVYLAARDTLTLIRSSISRASPDDLSRGGKAMVQTMSIQRRAGNWVGAAEQQGESLSDASLNLPRRGAK